MLVQGCPGCEGWHLSRHAPLLSEVNWLSKLSTGHLKAVPTVEVLACVVADLLGEVLGGAITLVKHAAGMIAANAELCRWVFWY